jgi:hypothetical protein
MPAPPLLRRSSNKAAALIIVLAFVVLLTGITLAYFSHTTSDRQLARSSYNDTGADLLARSAVDIIVSDLKKEILNGSGSPSPTASPVTLFVPTSNANMVPMRNNGEATIPNLIRRSLRSETALWPDLDVGPAVGSRPSAVNSTSDVSDNGRSVTLARWNSHYMVPKSNTTNGGSDPITTGYTAPSYWAPDWVFVTGAGPAVITEPNASVIGRYAYAIYDEGGLLDMNAAGYPSPMTILQYGRKGSLAFADLTGLPGLSTTAVDNVVGWRNYASAQPSGTLDPTNSQNFSFNSNAANTYYNFILSDRTNIQLTNYFTGSPLAYFTNFFLTSSGAVTPSPSPGRTDQALIARQELINLRSAASSGISFSNALQSLGTFSREALANIPQWTPAAPDAINPNFQTLLVTGSFTRNDGTTANVGDYLVNKRFLLQRLNWLTYNGPSALRNIPASAPALGNADYDMWLLTRGTVLADMTSIRFGLTSAFLQQGTAANILKYFGLVWDPTNERWNYTSPSGCSLASSIATFGVGGTQPATREPDFFELLRAGILDSSLGDSFSSDPALPLTHQQSKMLHILTVGANLIAQSRVDSYPVRIACTVNGTTMEAVGMPRLPCLSSLGACPVGVSQNGGGLHWFLIPNLWDPFRDSWDLTEATADNVGNGPNLTPGYLRPPVRITVTGDVGFGSATVSQSGIVDPTSITPFPTTIQSPNSSLTLQTGNTTPSGFGRDGLLEAVRLGALDINGSVIPLDPTQSSSGSAWNDIVRPTNDLTPYRNDHFVVIRLSLQGSSIPSGNTGNPVLILRSGFQVSLDYQSPNGQWYPYSFLQGNNATSTWITPVTPPGLGLCLATSFSQYGQPVGFTEPTITNAGASSLWSDLTGALAHSPMFGKGDPRSIRYNSQIGVVNLANPPMSFASAGILASIWPDTRATPPNPYTTPPPMFTTASPPPTPSPNPNPAVYCLAGDNGPAASNPYDEYIPPGSSNSIGDNVRPIMMNRPFRSVGEMGYAFRDQPFRTLSFSSSNSPDAGLLDLFTTNNYSDPSPTPTATSTPVMRAGVISLNSRQLPALAILLANTIRREDTPRTIAGSPPLPSPLPSPFTASDASYALTTLVSLTSNSPVRNKADLATLIANTNPVGFDATIPKTQRESIARAFAEAVQTRTWNLLIDMVAQTGRFKPNATNLQDDFVVEGEQHYWVHVAIDRFTDQIVDMQVEVVKE